MTAYPTRLDVIQDHPEEHEGTRSQPQAACAESVRISGDPQCNDVVEVWRSFVE